MGLRSVRSRGYDQIDSCVLIQRKALGTIEEHIRTVAHLIDFVYRHSQPWRKTVCPYPGRKLARLSAMLQSQETRIWSIHSKDTARVSRKSAANTFGSPFLQYVDDVESFDQELEDYIHRGYVQMKYYALQPKLAIF